MLGPVAVQEGCHVPLVLVPEVQPAEDDRRARAQAGERRVEVVNKGAPEPDALGEGGDQLPCLMKTASLRMNVAACS